MQLSGGSSAVWRRRNTGAGGLELQESRGDRRRRGLPRRAARGAGATPPGPALLRAPRVPGGGTPTRSPRTLALSPPLRVGNRTTSPDPEGAPSMRADHPGPRGERGPGQSVGKHLGTDFSHPSLMEHRPGLFLIRPGPPSGERSGNPTGDPGATRPSRGPRSRVPKARAQRACPLPGEDGC